MAYIRISDAKYSEEIRDVPAHHHNCYQILFLKRGSLTAFIGGKTYEVEAPSFLFISFMERHALVPRGTVYHRYYINLSMSAQNESPEEWPLLSVLSRRPENFCHVLHLKSGTAEEKAESVLKALVEEQAGMLPYAKERKDLLLRELLIDLYRQAPRLFPEGADGQDRIVWRVQRYLESNYQTCMDNQTIADEFHISKSYLSHLFREITGYSLHQYLMNCRLSAARVLLRETNRSVKEISYAVGFDDHCNFSRMFRQKFGMTPKEFRVSGGEDLS